jgi:hypothetical protein
MGSDPARAIGRAKFSDRDERDSRRFACPTSQARAASLTEAATDPRARATNICRNAGVNVRVRVRGDPRDRRVRQPRPRFVNAALPRGPAEDN